MKAGTDLRALRTALLQFGQLEAHTLFECPACGEQALGRRRCPECGVFGRALGLAGTCPHCDEPLLAAAFFALEDLPLPYP